MDTSRTVGEHIHDCTGAGMRCPCGYVFRVPPVSASIEVHDGDKTVLSDGFSCESVEDAIHVLRGLLERLEYHR